MIKITNIKTGTVYSVDETADVSDMERVEPAFFRGHGKRNTYEMYRGFMVNRHTVNYSAGPTRVTTVYIFGVCQGSLRPSSLCIVNASDGINSIRAAKKYVDKVIADGSFE